jgi:hypothetical protein
MTRFITMFYNDNKICNAACTAASANGSLPVKDVPFAANFILWKSCSIEAGRYINNNSRMTKSSLSNFLSFNIFLLFGRTKILRNRLTVILTAVLLLSAACKRKDVSTAPAAKTQQAANVEGSFSDPRFYNNIGAFIKPGSLGTVVCISGIGILISAGFLSARMGTHYFKAIQYTCLSGGFKSNHRRTSGPAILVVAGAFCQTKLRGQREKS